jgi:hypothetical protein
MGQTIALTSLALVPFRTPLSPKFARILRDTAVGCFVVVSNISVSVSVSISVTVVVSAVVLDYLGVFAGAKGVDVAPCTDAAITANIAVATIDTWRRPVPATVTTWVGSVLPLNYAFAIFFFRADIETSHLLVEAMAFAIAALAWRWWRCPYRPIIHRQFPATCTASEFISAVRAIIAFTITEFILQNILHGATMTIDFSILRRTITVCKPEVIGVVHALAVLEAFLGAADGVFFIVGEVILFV